MVRPWIQPEDVKEYSDFDDVKNRSNSKLKIDIQRAEAYIISYTNNPFSEEEYVDGVPENVKVADILLSEYFAHNKQTIGEKTSETYDDYAYTISSSTIDVTTLGIDVLLESYVRTKKTGRVTMVCRKL